MNRSCGHPWGEHPYLFEHELEESNPDTLAREEKLHPCRTCEYDPRRIFYVADHSNHPYYPWKKR